MSLYRVQFDLEPKVVTAAMDFLSTIKSYTVEWDKVGGFHRLEFMFEGRAAPLVLDFISEHAVHNVQGPVPAVEVKTLEHPEDLTSIINLKGKTRITTQDLRDALSSVGRSPNSTSYLAKELREAGLIRYHEGKSTTGIYDVLPPKKKKGKPSKKKAKKSAKKVVAKKGEPNGENL